MNRRRMLRTSAATLTALAYAPVYATAAELAKISIATVGAETSGAAMYAQDMGFFTQAGLDAKLDFFQSGAVIVNAVTTGSAEFGSSAVASLALARGRGLPVTIVAAGGLETGGMTGAVLVLKDAPIRTAADLTGKTLGVPGLATATQYTTQNWIDKTGGDSRSVKFVEAALAEMPAALQTHRIDAAALFEPGITLAMQTGNFRVLGNTAAAVAPRWLSSVYFSTDAYVQKNPGATRRFVAAIRQGSQWGNAHRNESTDILVKYTKMNRDMALKMGRDSLGTDVSAALIQPTLDLLMRYNAMPNPVTASQLIWNSR